MKKVYFYESNPERIVWERMVNDVNGEIVFQTPWKQCEELNVNSQKIIANTKQIEILAV